MRLTEQLEQRRLLAADISVTSKGTLLINGDETDNRVVIEFNNNGDGSGDDTLRAIVYPLNDGDTDSSNDDENALTSREVDVSDVKRIAIYTYGGNDVVSLNDDFFDEFQRHITVAGGDGDDRLSGDTNGPLLIDGGAGNDRLGMPATFDYGGLRKNRDVLNRYFDDKTSDDNNDDRGGQADTSSVSLVGGPGDDVLYAGYNTVVDGGDGNDTGYVGVAIDEDVAIPSSRLIGLSSDFYGRIASVNVDAFDAAIVGTSNGNDAFDPSKDLFGGRDANLDDDLFGSRSNNSNLS
jgi:hypothetical protein